MNTGSESSILNAISSVIAERKSNPPEKRSYVVTLLQGGVEAIGAKIIEEAAEVVEAAAEAEEEGRVHLVKEVADLVFHAMVMLGLRDTPWTEVEQELGRRFGIGGIEEKESRKKAEESRPKG